TNGQSDLINRKDTSAELKGLIDRVSVSMNAPDAARYDGLCRSVFGKEAHGAVMKFITACKGQDMEVEVTCLDMAGEDSLGECRRLAEKAGASFRLRKMNVVG
ncbi:MAG: radical SAM protein, partial [Candidatus Omnitrophota bacterium]